MAFPNVNFLCLIENQSRPLPLVAGERNEFRCGTKSSSHNGIRGFYFSYWFWTKLTSHRSRRPTHPVCVGAQFIPPFLNFLAKELLLRIFLLQASRRASISVQSFLSLYLLRWIVDPCCEMVRNDQKVRAENLILCTDWLLVGPVPAFLLSDRRRTNGEEVVDKGVYHSMPALGFVHTGSFFCERISPPLAYAQLLKHLVSLWLACLFRSAL